MLVDDGTTQYAQDLASPLSQILQTTQGSTTTNSVYGLDRLASVAGGVQTWYGYDALGSVRQTLDDAGTPLSVSNYDPWGAVETGTVPTFGFTGELQDGSSGLVNLRARWYDPGHGTFTSVDPFAGDPATPYSQHPYAYAYGNPVLYTDPTGRCSPIVDPTCKSFVWFIGEAIQGHLHEYSGFNDFAQYSAGVVEGGWNTITAPVRTVVNLSKLETWNQAGRGVYLLGTDFSGSATYIREQLADPVVRGLQLVWTNPIRATQILNENPRAGGQIWGAAAGTAGLAWAGNVATQAFKVTALEAANATEAGLPMTAMEQLASFSRYASSDVNFFARRWLQASRTFGGQVGTPNCIGCSANTAGRLGLSEEVLPPNSGQPGRLNPILEDDLISPSMRGSDPPYHLSVRKQNGNFLDQTLISQNMGSPIPYYLRRLLSVDTFSRGLYRQLLQEYLNRNPGSPPGAPFMLNPNDIPPGYVPYSRDLVP